MRIEPAPGSMGAWGNTPATGRGERGSDPVILTEDGNGEWRGGWRSKRAWEKGEMTDNGNYLENDEIAKRQEVDFP